MHQFHLSIHLRKASERSSSWTLLDGHFPLKMLSNTVDGPAPSVSDDLYSAAAAFAAATSSAILLLATRRLQKGTVMSGEVAVMVTGTKAATDPRMRDDDASKRGTNFRLWVVMEDVKRLLLRVIAKALQLDNVFLPHYRDIATTNSGEGDHGRRSARSRRKL